MLPVAEYSAYSTNRSAAKHFDKVHKIAAIQISGYFSIVDKRVERKFDFKPVILANLNIPSDMDHLPIETSSLLKNIYIIIVCKLVA